MIYLNVHRKIKEIKGKINGVQYIFSAEQNITEKKMSRWKYKLAAILILIFIMSALFLSWFYQESRPDPASAKIIREVAAKQLAKDPNDLTDDDFAKITEIHFQQLQLSDIKLLKKFTNIRGLYMGSITCPSKSIPKWISIMAKVGIIKPNKRIALNISPLKKLNTLEKLVIQDMPIYDTEPLTSMTNLKYLVLENTSITDIRPVRNLHNLKRLFLDGTEISNLEPLKNLKNLEYLNIKRCENITEEQVKDLQKALPNLEIVR